MVKITPVSVSGLEIEGGDRLDPVTVYFRDIGPREGQVVVICYGRAWSAFWGGMADKTVREFVASLDSYYLASKLATGRESKKDYDYISRIAATVIQATRESLANEPKGVA